MIERSFTTRSRSTLRRVWSPCGLAGRLRPPVWLWRRAAGSCAAAWLTSVLFLFLGVAEAGAAQSGSAAGADDGSAAVTRVEVRSRPFAAGVEVVLSTTARRSRVSASRDERGRIVVLVLDQQLGIPTSQRRIEGSADDLFESIEVALDVGIPPGVRLVVAPRGEIAYRVVTESDGIRLLLGESAVPAAGPSVERQAGPDPLDDPPFSRVFELQPGGYARATTRLNVRAAPGLQFERVAGLDLGALVEVIDSSPESLEGTPEDATGESFDAARSAGLRSASGAGLASSGGEQTWALVRLASTPSDQPALGWVAARFLAPASPRTGRPWVDRARVVPDRGLNVRAAASADAEVLGALPEGAAVYLGERQDDWVEIGAGSLHGWAASRWLAPVATSRNEGTDLDRDLAVTASELREGLRIAGAEGVAAERPSRTAEMPSRDNAPDSAATRPLDSSGSVPDVDPSTQVNAEEPRSSSARRRIGPEDLELDPQAEIALLQQRLTTAEEALRRAQEQSAALQQQLLDAPAVPSATAESDAVERQLEELRLERAATVARLRAERDAALAERERAEEELGATRRELQEAVARIAVLEADVERLRLREAEERRTADRSRELQGEVARQTTSPPVAEPERSQLVALVSAWLESVSAPPRERRLFDAVASSSDPLQGDEWRKSLLRTLGLGDAAGAALDRLGKVELRLSALQLESTSDTQARATFVVEPATGAFPRDPEAFGGWSGAAVLADLAFAHTDGIWRIVDASFERVDD